MSNGLPGIAVYVINSAAINRTGGTVDIDCGYAQFWEREAA